MKTSVTMIRKMGKFEVKQRTSDSYFDGNALLTQWNKIKSNPQRAMSRFLESEKTKEFISALKEELSQSDNMQLGDIQIIKEVKSINTKKGKTKAQVWMHPFLFIKFAMWINPRFEVQVIKFVYDELVKNRHKAGDNYLTLSSAISSFPDSDYRKTAIAMQWVVFNKTGKELRQNATEEQLQEIYELEHQLTFSINMGFVKNQEELLVLLRKMYAKKYLRF